jgi:hypothetical protein
LKSQNLEISSSRTNFAEINLKFAKLSRAETINPTPTVFVQEFSTLADRGDLLIGTPLYLLAAFSGSPLVEVYISSFHHQFAVSCLCTADSQSPPLVGFY